MKLFRGGVVVVFAAGEPQIKLACILLRVSQKTMCNASPVLTASRGSAYGRNGLRQLACAENAFPEPAIHADQLLSPSSPIVGSWISDFSILEQYQFSEWGCSHINLCSLGLLAACSGQVPEDVVVFEPDVSKASLYMEKKLESMKSQTLHRLLHIPSTPSPSTITTTHTPTQPLCFPHQAHTSTAHISPKPLSVENFIF